AIIEYRKVAANWPKTHLADDALFAVGNIYLSMNETVRGREAMLELARSYPESPLADDALLKVGQSYEAEAQQLAGVTRGRAEEINKLVAQRDAYRQVQGARRQMRFDNEAMVAELRKKGQKELADVAQARFAGQFLQFNLAGTIVAAQAAERQVEALTAAQLADRQDKINAALRQAVGSYQKAAKVAAADKADEALLQMARIYDEKLKDSEAAMATWQEIVRQFSGTAVAEDASWRIAQFHERQHQYAEAIQAYQAFLRNYRRSSRAADAQFAVAESYEHLGEWVKAMDAYTNYINNFPKAPMVQKAREQISWIKTYRL
ncbi:MAG: tetratricopeptide repeat protein, partial [Phycisphaerae bacterium]